MKDIKNIDRSAEQKPTDDAKTTWIEPKIYCEIEYASFTENGTYREPVFVRLRQDLEVRIK